MGIAGGIVPKNGCAQPVFPDSTQRDSIRKKNIRPYTRVISSTQLYNQDFQFGKPKESLDLLQYWDDLDTLAGYVNHLGLVGKYYRHTRYGIADKMLPTAHWQNPVTGNPFVYMPSQSNIRYFDTKTPYIRINFAQGPQRESKIITLLDVLFSQNVTPFWNVTAFYKRRQAQSAYGYHTTDNRNIYLSNYFHTFNNRYQLLGDVQYNEIKNALNGGVFKAFGDSTMPSNTLGAAINLYDANTRLFQKAAGITQFYHLLRESETATIKQTLSFKNALRHEYVYQIFEGKNVTYSQMQEIWINPLPALEDTATALHQAVASSSYDAQIEANYHVKLGNALQIRAYGGLHYKYIRFVRKGEELRTFNVEQSIVKPNVHGELKIPKLNFRYYLDFYTAATNLYKPETFFQNRVLWQPFQVKFRQKVTDSTQVSVKFPVNLAFVYSLFDQNPTFYQAYFQGGQGSVFRGNANLNNQQIQHLHAKLSIDGVARIRMRDRQPDTLLANHVYVQPFFTRVSQFIYYGDSMRVKQAAIGQSLNYTGLEVGGRVRFWRKMYFQLAGCVQQGIVTAAPDTFFAQYKSYIPNAYAKASLYYQNNQVKYGVLRVGLDVWYNTQFLGQGIDAASGEFYAAANPYPVMGYPRIDVFFSTHIQRANIFLKVVNVGDGLIAPSYFTTPLYPGLPRMLNLGLNWTFFD